MNEHPVIEATLEISESVLDTLIDNEILQSIPVVGSSLKLIKGAGQIRDRLFAAKLLRFIKTLNQVPQNLKDEIRDRVSKSPKESQKVGETVVLLLDRLADLDKAELTAILFVAYTYGHLKSLDFQRLCQSIDQAFMGDVRELLARSHNIGRREPSNEAFLQALYPSGLTMILGGKEVKSIGEIYFAPSSLGKKLINAYVQGMKLCQPINSADPKGRAAD